MKYKIIEGDKFTVEKELETLNLIWTIRSTNTVVIDGEITYCIVLTDQ